ncbi:MAG: hypothetical protein PHV63_04260 [Candidatus Daviesbacteria bacterium]|nr:hypothetical protein [Candidatus Daviesbacteria bacterium]
MVLKKPIIIGVIIAAVVVIALGLNKPFSQQSQDDFKAPGRNWQSQKKVEDYFVSNLHMTPEDLKRQEDRKEISFYITDGSTPQGIIGNLTYYGFARNEKALQYALENTEDKTGGKDEAIKVGNNGTIDIKAFYRISEDMTAWELADTLLNKPNFYGSHGDYGYLFMP